MATTDSLFALCAVFLLQFDGLTRTWALYWAATRPFPGTVLPPGASHAAGDVAAHMHAAKILLITLGTAAAFALSVWAVSTFFARRNAAAKRNARPRRSDYEPVLPQRQISDFDLGRTPHHGPVQPVVVSYGATADSTPSKMDL